MGLFAGGRDWDKIDRSLKGAFAGVRQDTATLYEWIQFLHRKLERQQQTIIALQDKFDTHLLTPQDIRQLLESHFAIRSAQQLDHRVRQLDRKVGVLAALHDGQHTRLSELHKRLDSLHTVAEKKSASLKERIIRKLTRNSKAYAKNVILSYIEKYREVSATQLKEMLVEEQRLCSKSSLYRLLQELEDTQKVSVVHDSKQKTYFSRSIKAPKEHIFDEK